MGFRFARRGYFLSTMEFIIISDAAIVFQKEKQCLSRAQIAFLELSWDRVLKDLEYVTDTHSFGTLPDARPSLQNGARASKAIITRPGACAKVNTGKL